MTAPTERQVNDWLALLGRLVASNMTPDEAMQRLRSYTPLLLARFDSRDFNAASREFVARNCKFFPSYGELCDLLDKWPRPIEKPAVTTSVDAGLDAMDRSWIEFWHRRRAEIFAMQSGWKWGSRDADLANVESLIRQQSLKAWRQLFAPQHAEHQPPSEREMGYVASVVAPFRDGSHRERGHAPEPPKPSYHPPEVLAHRRPAYGLEVPGDAEIRTQTAEADA